MFWNCKPLSHVPYPPTPILFPPKVPSPAHVLLSYIALHTHTHTHTHTLSLSPGFL
jgi:hypothetical protein